jgi:outer membrane immunogenic protein
MFRTLTLAVGAAALQLGCGFAYAADLEPVPAYAAPPIAAYNWTGIYLGANGGYAFGQSTPMGLFTDSFSAFSINANGWLAGATVGAQIQSGHVVMGLEGDIDWMNLNGSSRGTISFNGAPIGMATLSSSVSAFGTLRPRISARLEYLWIGAGTFNTLTENIVRGGLNFRFGM